jgi:hypothetical protein
MSASIAEEIRADSYVGFDSITQQIEHKLLKRGFQFNVIVVGMYSQLCVLTFDIDFFLPDIYFNIFVE